MRAVILRSAFIFAVFINWTLSACFADDSSWEHGLSVQLPESRMRISDVVSQWANDPTFLNGRVQQGPIYFNDCLTLVNAANVVAVRVQVAFAPVGVDGSIKRPVMPFDLWTRLEPGARRSVCRDHAYANGAKGWWLVGWVSAVDFADGSSWRAPTGTALQAAIVEALGKSPLSSAFSPQLRLTGADRYDRRPREPVIITRHAVSVGAGRLHRDQIAGAQILR
jgi:hypothetical protein